MCFSATASFVTGGVVGVVGILALRRARTPREAPLAAMPLLFAVQQGLEGALWLDLGHSAAGAHATGLSTLFLVFAEIVWPVAAPIAVLLVEPVERRRMAMAVCLSIGIGLAATLAWWISSTPVGAAIVGRQLAYLGAYPNSFIVMVAYLAATALPLMISSWRTVNLLGTLVLAGFAIAYLIYWQAFVSVWCFFAAAASFVVFYHFGETARADRLRRFAAVHPATG